MSLEHLRRSKIFRFIAFVLIFDFFFSQTTYAQEEFQVQEGTHLYTPVKEVSADRLETGGHPEESFDRHAERSEASQDRLRDEGSLVVDSSAPPQNDDQFLNSSSLSAPTVEIHVDETLVEVPDKNISSPLVGEDEGGGNIVDYPPSLPSPARGEGDAYDFDLYSFEDALDLIRPEFAAAESVMNKWNLWSYGF